jgi:ABC-2 type transport system ATP-binding protein
MSREGLLVDVVGLTKMFGTLRAVDDLTFTVRPGRVTGFLGPNGSGKTTTLRCLLGLLRPTAGSATIGGRRYADLDDPIGTVGASLEASSFHPGRSAQAHLEAMALGAGMATRPARARAEAMLAQVGLAEFGDKRVGGYSLGMRQRLALAAALLGDPGVLVLDEPANGLDPAGIAWLRQFLRALAAEGRTVLVSSHVLSEVQQTVDDVVVLAQGRLVHQGTLADLDSGPGAVLLRTPDPSLARATLVDAGLEVHDAEAGRLRVVGASAQQVGHVAFTGGLELHELVTEAGGLERIFLELTGPQPAPHHQAQGGRQ